MSNSKYTDPLTYSQDFESENQFNSPDLFNSKLRTITFVSTNQKKLDPNCESPRMEVMYNENAILYEDHLRNIKTTNLEKVFVNENMMSSQYQDESPANLLNSNLISPKNQYLSHDGSRNICLSLSTERKTSTKNSGSNLPEDTPPSKFILEQNHSNINKDEETVWFTAREDSTERSNCQRYYNQNDNSNNLGKSLQFVSLKSKIIDNSNNDSNFVTAFNNNSLLPINEMTRNSIEFNQNENFIEDYEQDNENNVKNNTDTQFYNRKINTNLPKSKSSERFANRNSLYIKNKRNNNFIQEQQNNNQQYLVPKIKAQFTNNSLETIHEKSSVFSQKVFEKTISSNGVILNSKTIGNNNIPENSSEFRQPISLKTRNEMLLQSNFNDSPDENDKEFLYHNKTTDYKNLENQKHDYALLYENRHNTPRKSDEQQSPLNFITESSNFNENDKNIEEIAKKLIVIDLDYNQQELDDFTDSNNDFIRNVPFNEDYFNEENQAIKNDRIQIIKVSPRASKEKDGQDFLLNSNKSSGKKFSKPPYFFKESQRKSPIKSLENNKSAHTGSSQDLHENNTLQKYFHINEDYLLQDPLPKSQTESVPKTYTDSMNFLSQKNMLNINNSNTSNELVTQFDSSPKINFTNTGVGSEYKDDSSKPSDLLNLNSMFIYNNKQHLTSKIRNNLTDFPNMSNTVLQERNDYRKNTFDCNIENLHHAKNTTKDTIIIPKNTRKDSCSEDCILRQHNTEQQVGSNMKKNVFLDLDNKDKFIFPNHSIKQYSACGYNNDFQKCKSLNQNKGFSRSFISQNLEHANNDNQISETNNFNNMMDLNNQTPCAESSDNNSNYQALEENIQLNQKALNKAEAYYKNKQHTSQTKLVDNDQVSVLNSLVENADHRAQSEKINQKISSDTGFSNTNEFLRMSNPEIPQAMQNDEVSVHELETDFIEEENINDKHEYQENYMHYSNTDDNDIIDLTKSSLINSRVVNQRILNSVTKYTFESDMEIENIHEDNFLMNNSTNKNILLKNDDIIQIIEEDINQVMEVDDIVQIMEENYELKDKSITDSRIIDGSYEGNFMNKSNSNIAFENLENCSNLLGLNQEQTIEEKTLEEFSKEDSYYINKNLNKSCTSAENTIMSHIDLNRKSSQHLIPQINNNQFLQGDRSTKQTITRAQSQNQYATNNELPNSNLELNQETPVLGINKIGKYILEKNDENKMTTMDYTSHNSQQKFDTENNECQMELKDKIHDLKEQINTPYQNFNFMKVSTDFSAHNPYNTESQRSSILAKVYEGDFFNQNEIMVPEFVYTHFKNSKPNSNNHSKKISFDQYDYNQNNNFYDEEAKTYRLPYLKENYMNNAQHSPENAYSMITENKVVSTDIGFFSPPVSTHDRVLYFNKDHSPSYNLYHNNQTYVYTNNDSSSNLNTVINTGNKNRTLILNSSNKKKLQINQNDSDEINFRKSLHKLQTDLNQTKYNKFDNIDNKAIITTKPKILFMDSNINTSAQVSPSGDSEFEAYQNQQKMISSQRNLQHLIDVNYNPEHRGKKSSFSMKQDYTSDVDKGTSQFTRTVDSQNNFKLKNSTDNNKYDSVQKVQKELSNGNFFI